MLGLPLIRNVKTVDPADPSSPEVFQIETAMGAAIEVFEGAQAIVVGRGPVPAGEDHQRPAAAALRRLRPRRRRACCAWPCDTAPLVDLDPKYYKTMARFDAHFPAGPPSLREAQEPRRCAATGPSAPTSWSPGAPSSPTPAAPERLADGARIGTAHPEEDR